MGWDDRPYYRDHSTAAHVLSRVLGVSAPMGRILGLPLRAHLSLVLLILLLLAFPIHNCPFGQRALACGVLLVVLLVHELSHFAAARMLGGSGDEILLWPLGGLEYPLLPRRTRSALLTIAAGPLSTAALCTAGGLSACWFCPPVAGAHSPAATVAVVDFNPMHAFNPAPHELNFKGASIYGYWLFSMGYLVFVANLLPAYPLDGGHFLQALFARKLGANRAMQITSNIGSIGAMIVLVVGCFALNPVLVIGALVAVLACWQRALELRERLGDGMLPGGVDFASSLFNTPPARPRKHLSRRAIRRARKIVLREAAERTYLDTILAKVSSNGIGSLTWREKRTLKKATAMQRMRDDELSNWKD